MRQGFLLELSDALRLLAEPLPYRLSAKTSYELDRDGVHCMISLPVSSAADLEEDYD